MMRVLMCISLIGLLPLIVPANSTGLPPISPENMTQLALAAWYDQASPPFITTFAFSPDGSQLVIAQWDQITLISTSTFEIQKTLKISPGRNFSHLVFSPDGSRLISYGGPNDSGFSVWDLAAGQHLFSGNVILRLWELSVEHASFNPDDPNQIIIYISNSFISIWDVAARQEVDRMSEWLCKSTNFTHSPLCQLFDYVTPDQENHLNPDGTLLVEKDEDGLWLIDPITLQRHNVAPAAIRYDTDFNSDGSLLSVFTDWDHRLQIYGVFECTVISQNEVNLRTAPTTSATVGRALRPDMRIGVYGSQEVDGFTWYQVVGSLWVREDVVEHACLEPG